MKKNNPNKKNLINIILPIYPCINNLFNNIYNISTLNNRIHT